MVNAGDSCQMPSSRDRFLLAGFASRKIREGSGSCFVNFVLGVFARRNAETFRVNSGGPAYIDSKGHSWSADYGFNTGSLSHSAPEATVIGTSDPTLFKNARVGTSSGADL